MKKRSRQRMMDPSKPAQTHDRSLGDTGATSPAPAGPSDASLPGPARWHWYHYYFVLALVDVLVIAASVLMIHRTTRSYEVAIQKLTNTHTRQRWVANLRLHVMKLNAPGNDVFDTRRVQEERARFESQRVALMAELRRQKKLDLDLVEFQMHLNRMIVEEEKIFRLLEPTENSGLEDSTQLLEGAIRAMAAMDRHQTEAVTALTEIEQGLLMRVESLLREHGGRIQGHVAFERIFLGIMALILVGMFWYGRKLQRLHEEMVLHRQHALSERMARLAAVGEVCAAVAHGIRNPLAAISSSAQLCLATNGQDNHARLEDILSECRRLNDRVTHLLTFASTKTRIDGRFNLKSAVEQAIGELQSGFQEKGVGIAMEADPNIWVLGDRERMVQSMIELFSNAMAYAPENSKVMVRTQANPARRGFIDLFILDQGPGIPPNVADKVFDLFFTTRPGGTGVGLASVKQTVDSLGGEIRVVSDVRGACLCMTLPAQN